MVRKFVVKESMFNVLKDEFLKYYCDMLFIC